MHITMDGATWRSRGKRHAQQAAGQSSRAIRCMRFSLLVAISVSGLCLNPPNFIASIFGGALGSVSLSSHSMGSRHVALADLWPVKPRKLDCFMSCRVQADGQQVECTSVKAQLLSLVAASNRATDKSKDEAIVAAFEALEKLNPCTAPLESPLLKGEWELIWTTSDSILGLSRPWLFRPRARKPILQYLDPANGFARNLEYTPLGKNRVEATIVPLSEDQLETFANRSPRKGLKFKTDNSPGGTYLPKGVDVKKNTVGVKFNKFIILGLIHVKAPEKARGILQVTYLDDTLRLSRGDRGNLFVLRKVGDEQTK